MSFLFSGNTSVQQGQWEGCHLWGSEGKEVVSISLSRCFLNPALPQVSLFTLRLSPCPYFSRLDAFLLLTLNHSTDAEYLSRFVIIIFQHPAQGICCSRTTPALPVPKEPLGGTPVSVGLHCTPQLWVILLHFCVSSFTTVSRWRVVSRPGESLTALPTVLNTK